MTFCVNFAEISLLCAICGQQTDDIIPSASAIGGGGYSPCIWTILITSHVAGMCQHADCCCDVITAHYKLSILCECSVRNKSCTFSITLKWFTLPMGGRSSDFYCHFTQVLTARGFLLVREVALDMRHCPKLSCGVMCYYVPGFLAHAVQNLSDNILSTQKSLECHLCLMKMPSSSDETAAAHQQGSQLLPVFLFHLPLWVLRAASCIHHN